MDDGTRLPISFIISIILLLLGAAYFALCETAIASCSRTRIKAAADRGEAKAVRALSVLDNFEKAINTIVICTNIVHIAIATVVTVFVTKRWGIGWVTLSTVITTVTVFFVGEMLPKSIAKKLADKLAQTLSGGILFFMRLFSPASSALSAIGSAVSNIGGSGEAEVSVTEDELYDIIEDMTEEGALDEDQGDLISSALQFGDLTVESILTPRVDVTAIDVDDSIEEILKTVMSQNHSRLPVYEGSIDNIIGILQLRKFIKAYLKEKDRLNVRSLIDRTMFVHGSGKVDELLTEMTARRLNIAIVTDNYGGTLGIVTIEDILEELVGEIWDEDDVVEEAITPIGENTYRVDAGETVSDVFEAMDFEDPEDNEELVNTLMGEWAYEQFTSIPEPGSEFNYHNLKITVSHMEQHRIISLDVEILPPEAEGGAD